jgi:predicted protein tyrosine phosphatase
MFGFKVLGLSEAELEFDRNWPTKIVSAVSPEIGLKARGSHHLILPIADVHVEQDGAATMDDLHRMFDHTRDMTDDDRLVIHCFAGQSRSAALMIAVLIQHGSSATEAFNAVLLNRKVMIPNQLITRLTDDHFNLSGELIEIVRQHTIEALRKPERSASVTKAQSTSMKSIMDLFD